MPLWCLDVTQFYRLDIPHAPALRKIAEHHLEIKNTPLGVSQKCSDDGAAGELPIPPSLSNRSVRAGAEWHRGILDIRLVLCVPNIIPGLDDTFPGLQCVVKTLQSLERGFFAHLLEVLWRVRQLCVHECPVEVHHFFNDVVGLIDHDREEEFPSDIRQKSCPSDCQLEFVQLLNERLMIGVYNFSLKVRDLDEININYITKGLKKQYMPII